MRGEIGFSGDAELTRFARSGLRRKEGGKFHVIVRNSSSILNISFEKTQLCQKNLRASKNGSGAAVVRSKYSKNISFTPKRSTLLQGGEVKSQGEQRRRSHWDLIEFDILICCGWGGIPPLWRKKNEEIKMSNSTRSQWDLVEFDIFISRGRGGGSALMEQLKWRNKNVEFRESSMRSRRIWCLYVLRAAGGFRPYGAIKMKKSKCRIPRDLNEISSNPISLCAAGRGDVPPQWSNKNEGIKMSNSTRSRLDLVAFNIFVWCGRGGSPPPSPLEQ